MDEPRQPGRQPSAPPEPWVRAMFDDLVYRYDLMNGVLSLGLDRYWRRAAVRALRPSPGELVLDLGCGTGELTRALASAGARVVGVDVSRGMLAAAHRHSAPFVRHVGGSAFRLPFPDETFAAAASAFVLRNLDDLDAALAELARVSKGSARLALVDITEPRSAALRKPFDAYLATVVPAVGAMIGKRDAYRYLVRSLSHLPPPADVCSMLERAGFDRASWRPLTGGIVTLFTAVRARDEGRRR